MSANTQAYIDHVVESLQDIGEIKVGRMFGGTGLKQNNIQFAMLMGNALFFVVDDKTRPMYEKAGMQCFWYTTKKGRVNVRKYFEVPPDLLEDQEQLLEWAKLAVDTAKRLYKPKKM